MVRVPDRKIILEDGEEYYGYSFGSDSEKILEIVFNTSMTGYQEILSDPSYTDQAVVMTYPLIGNYGMTEDDYESVSPSLGAMIVREYTHVPSNHRSVKTLDEVMKEYSVAGIFGVDTRRLNRSIRDRGSRKALLTGAGTPVEEGLRKIKNHIMPRDAVSRVSCRAASHYDAADARLHVAAIDCGIKEGIIRSLLDEGCSVTVLPWNSSAEEIMALMPDGVLVSNGPGDPTDVPETIAAVRSLLGKVPVFSICLGHQILSLAYGAKTYKMKFGHRGGNHPVKDLLTGRVDITSQNHSYAVDESTLAGTGLAVTHLNLLDGTVEGVSCPRDRCFGIQYHPEGSPGPNDSRYMFRRFTAMMEEYDAEKK